MSKTPADWQIIGLVKGPDPGHPDWTKIRYRDAKGQEHRRTIDQQSSQTDIISPDDDEWPQVMRRLRNLADAETITRFDMGDLCLAIAPMGDVGLHNQATENLAKAAAEADIDLTALESYRKVAFAWPVGTRVPTQQASWSVHRGLMSLPDEDKAQVIAELTAAAPSGRVTVKAAQEWMAANRGVAPEPLVTERSIVEGESHDPIGRRVEGSVARSRPMNMLTLKKELGRIQVSLDRLVKALPEMEIPDDDEEIASLRETIGDFRFRLDDLLGFLPRL